MLLSRHSPSNQRSGPSLAVEFLDSCDDGLVEGVNFTEGLMGKVMRLEVAPDDNRCR